MPELLTISEAAERMHVTRQTIYAWIRKGSIRPVMTPGGRRRIPADQLTVGKPQQLSCDVFPIRNVSDLEPIQHEPMGTKEKYWFPRAKAYWYWDRGGQYREFIFKAGREGTGENWAEKVAGEACALLDLPHADYDLAVYRNTRGVISPTFVPAGAILWHGNQVLSSYVSGYEKSKRYHQTKHTVSAVFDVLGAGQIQPPPDWSSGSGTNSASDVFTGYLMLDAWVANTDRHHENWGLIVIPDSGVTHLAPTFDHASSLGRSVTDDERRERLTTKDSGRNMDHYVQRARSAFYLDQEDPRPLPTLEAFRQAAHKRPEAARYWLEKLRRVSHNDIEAVIGKVPREAMSDIAKRFAGAILDRNRERLLTLKI